MAGNEPEIDPITERICKLISMFGAEENVAKVAFTKLRNLFAQEGISFNDLADVIRKAAKGYYSGEEVIAAADKAKDLGEQEGYAKAKREATLPPEFYDSTNEPNWYAIARYTKEKLTQLKPGFETEFVRDTPEKMLSYGRPRSAKQARWILTFFIRAGGVVPPGIEFDGEHIS